MRVCVTGATGFIGSRLLERLERPVVLSRNPQVAEQKLSQYGVTAHRWDADTAAPE